MKIIFLNTWHGELKDELRAYVARHLDSTAVFCFQEAGDEDRAAYEDLLKDTFVMHKGLRRNDVNGSWYGNVIYVRNDIPIVETGTIFSTAPKGYEVGFAAYVTVRLNNRDLTLCNVHGVPYPGTKLDSEARILQSQTFLDTFAGRKSVIIGGDFNLLPETKSVQLFGEHGYQNLIADYAIATTRNHITFAKYPDDIQYYADFVFASPDVQVTDFTVPSDVVSDHQPLELTIREETIEDALHIEAATELVQ